MSGHTSSARNSVAITGTHRVASAYRIVDWSRLDSVPPPADVDRLLHVASDGARLAVLVGTPKTLMAATVFAEQAELKGARVRVFVGATEAMAWLYRDLPEEALTHEWPVAPLIEA